MFIYSPLSTASWRACPPASSFSSLWATWPASGFASWFYDYLGFTWRSGLIKFKLVGLIQPSSASSCTLMVSVPHPWGTAAKCNGWLVGGQAERQSSWCTWPNDNKNWGFSVRFLEIKSVVIWADCDEEERRRDRTGRHGFEQQRKPTRDAFNNGRRIIEKASLHSHLDLIKSTLWPLPLPIYCPNLVQDSIYLSTHRVTTWPAACAHHNWQGQ